MKEARGLSASRDLSTSFPILVERYAMHMEPQHQVAIVVKGTTGPEHFHTTTGQYLQIYGTCIDALNNSFYKSIPIQSTQKPRTVPMNSCVLLGVQVPRGGLVVDEFGGKPSKEEMTQHPSYELSLSVSDE